MKATIILIALFLNNVVFAQVTNVSAGVWSNTANWSNHLLPVDTTDIILNFDLIVDINSTCRSLQTNGHNVTINAGVSFGVNGINVSVIDIDGNIYPTVLIGTQHWMVKNLDVSHYRNGDTIPEVRDPVAWTTLTTGAWCYRENNMAFGRVYGKLYNWYAVNDPRGLAPQGWRVPSDLDWATLETFMGDEGPGTMGPGGKIKEAGTTHWDPPNSADNRSGFTGLPGGYRSDYNGDFLTSGYMGWWWGTSEINASYARAWYLDISEYVQSQGNTKKNGYSVRCLRN